MEKTDQARGDDKARGTSHGEVESHPSEARRLERELGLGVKKTESPTPGMPAAQGGGLTSEIGTSHPETDPDR